MSDDSKKDSATTAQHIIFLIEMWKERKVLTSLLSKIWENNDGCAEKYICASALYIIPVMPKCYSVIIDCGIIAPGNGK